MLHKHFEICENFCIGYEYVTDKFVNEGAEEQTPI